MAEGGLRGRLAARCGKSMAALCVDCAWPEGGAAPALMLEYQKSLGRRTALGPDESVFFAAPKANSRRRQGGGRAAGAAHRRRRAPQAFGRRAYSRASSSDSRHLFERNERSECSELCRADKSRGAQGTRSAAKGKPLRCACGPHVALQAQNATQATCGRWQTAAVARFRSSPTLSAAIDAPTPPPAPTG